MCLLEGGGKVNRRRKRVVELHVQGQTLKYTENYYTVTLTVIKPPVTKEQEQ